MPAKRSWVVFGAAALALAYGVFAYNRLVTLREALPGAWAQVENVLQRRFDLIPNLVSTVKGYAKHERGLLVEVTTLRSRWNAAKTPAERAAAANALDGVLPRLLAVAEAYPQLKASENFARLQDELAGSENRIAVARMRYNETLRAYNTAVARFPSNLVASWFGFRHDDTYLRMEGKAAVPVKVEF